MRDVGTPSRNLFTTLFLASFSGYLLLAACSTMSPKNKRLESADLPHKIEVNALNYFLEQSNPETGLVRDWADNFGPTPESDRSASLAATGFGLTVIANASKRGLVSHEFARNYALKTLRFCQDHVPRRKGWFLHFVDWQKGTRILNSEYSTIDTAIFLAGALYADRVLRDPEVTKIVHQLYVETDFKDMLTDGGAKPDKRTLSMAFWEKRGYEQRQWDHYAEQSLLLLLGLGHPVNPLSRDAWLAVDRSLEMLPNGQKVMGGKHSLFVHQYSQLFVDFRQFQDGFANYHQNSIAATAWHRELMARDKSNKTLQAGFWGFSAGQSPRGYEGWDPGHYEGIVCIGCTVASVQFLPQVVMKDLENWYSGPYRDQIWGRYGFTDSIDIGQKWYAHQVLGITVGPEYIAFANLSQANSVWADFMQIPEIRLGLERASGMTPHLAVQPRGGAKRTPAQSVSK